ncbi:hypothetical protein KSP40_PGU017699 [Platanthera guangdongensis]|uniref:Glycoside hydrolase family 31 N-terminal domain-containing protein n=1 Tax=Platanthera guangdongensis TaxID=2320717 RepID=A0ABR2MX22_9ASPA
METNTVRMRSIISSNAFFLFLAALSLLSSPSLSQEDSLVGYGYRFISSQADVSGNLLTAQLQVIRNSSVYGADIPKLYFAASFENKHQLRIRITDAEEPRWEVPTEIIPRQRPSEQRPNKGGSAAARGHAVLSPPDSDLVLVLTSSSPFGFTVSRRSSGEILFRTDGGSLVFKDRYLEISSSLPGDRANLYGIGEHTRKSFRLVPGDKLTLWNADTPAMNPDVNLYGSHPFYMDVRSPEGKAHGVLLLNSNGMDVIYSGNSITYRVIGGVLDFYIFAGPSPVEVLDQYTELIGRPAPMPYWSFGEWFSFSKARVCLICFA